MDECNFCMWMIVGNFANELCANEGRLEFIGNMRSTAREGAIRTYSNGTAAYDDNVLRGSDLLAPVGDVRSDFSVGSIVKVDRTRPLASRSKHKIVVRYTGPIFKLDAII